MTITNPTQHNMARRSATHDYSRPGIYHITMHVAEGMGQPLGAVVGSDESNVCVALTPAGAMVERELLTAISTYYPMVTVDTYVIMPEHLHFILTVTAPIVSSSGRPTHLGQVIAGFKKGCNRAYWVCTGQEAPAGKPLGTLPPAAPAPAAPAASTPAAAPAASSPATAPAASTPAANSVPGGLPAGAAAAVPIRGRIPYNGSTGRQPLFAYGYCDVMPIEPGQLELQREYIRNNPRSRWLRHHDSSRLQTQRGGIDTALTPGALRGYLQRECPPSLLSPDALALIERRLLLANGHIACDSYGERALLQRRLLPVVCHRCDAARLDEQKRRCLEEAAQGAVLVSPRIAKGEQAIIDEAMRQGFPVVLIADNGFPTIYHPSTERIALCAEGCLILVTPWQYQYRGKNETVSVPFCKTMNCVAQALCRLKDDWWKT